LSQGAAAPALAGPHRPDPPRAAGRPGLGPDPRLGTGVGRLTPPAAAAGKGSIALCRDHARPGTVGGDRRDRPGQPPVRGPPVQRPLGL